MKYWVGLGMKLWCTCRYVLCCHSNEVILSDVSVCMIVDISCVTICILCADDLVLGQMSGSVILQAMLQA